MNQVIPVQFQGVQEGADPKSLPPGTMLLAKNARMDKARRLRKRGGIRPFVLTGVTDEEGLRLFETADGALGMVGSEHVYSYSVERTRWRLIERVAPWIIKRRPLVDSYKSVSCVDIAMVDNRLVVVWMAADVLYTAGGSGQPVYAQVFDVRTWDPVCDPVLMGSTGRFPKVTILGGDAHIFYMSNAGQIVTNKLSLTTYTTAGAINTFAGYVATSPFDLDNDGTDLFTIGVLAAGATRIEVRRILTTHASAANVTLTGTAASCVCVDALGPVSAGKGQILVSYGDTGATRVVTLDRTTLATVTGPTTFAAATSPSQCFAMYDDNNDEILAGHVSGGTGLQTETLVYTTHATIANTVRQTRDIQNVAKPVRLRHGNVVRWHTSALVAVPDENYEFSPPSRVLVELRIDAVVGDPPTHPQVGTLENLTGWQWQGSSSAWMPNSVYSASRKEAFFVSTFRHREGKYLSYISCGANINTVTCQTGERHKPLRAGNTRMLVGAVPRLFDGASAQPYGFTHAPQIWTAVPGAAASGQMGAGSYQYQACFVRIGPDGIKQRSPMSDIVTEGAVVATGSVTLTIYTGALSCKMSEDAMAAALGTYAALPYQTFIEIYRTTANGSVLYRLTLTPAYNIVQNDPLNQTVTFVDTRSDTDITATPAAPIRLDAQEQPYTEVELDDVPPPGAITGVVHRDRFVLIDTTGFNLWFSKKSGDVIQVAPGFNEALVLPFARKRSALVSLDEKLVAFSEEDIDIVHGDGPDAAGGGASWEVQRVQSDVGCINPRSVVATPVGVIFESRRGLEILSRDLSVSRIGKTIEDTLADYPYITSATLVEQHHEVRFTCNNVDQGEDVLIDDGAILGAGIVLAWDYLHNVWFVRQYRDAGTVVTSCPFVDSIVIDGTYYLLDPSGRVYAEQLDDCFDYSSGEVPRWVERDIKLAPFSPSGTGLGWHRVKDVLILGTSKSPHVLEVSAELDFDELGGGGYSQVETFAEGSEATDVGATNKARVTFAEQKLQAISLRIRDLTPASLVDHTGEGPILEALAFRAQVKRGAALASDGESK